ncbi:unnamed protein product [Meganyctiphanes norvegica]|uniref:NADH dehydrogenase subunit 6 n=1 Tax=Meganyctiphanes norvegica TaxID=48144 RepID=A0AAV2PQX2_MEGNR
MICISIFSLLNILQACIAASLPQNAHANNLQQYTMDHMFEKDEWQKKNEMNEASIKFENETNLNNYGLLPKYDSVVYVIDGQIIDNSLSYYPVVDDLFIDHSLSLEPRILFVEFIPILLTIILITFLKEFESHNQNRIVGDIDEEFDFLPSESEIFQNLEVDDNMKHNTNQMCKVHLFSQSLSCINVFQFIFIIAVILYLCTNPIILLFGVMLIILMTIEKINPVVI